MTKANGKTVKTVKAVKANMTKANGKTVKTVKAVKANTDKGAIQNAVKVQGKAKISALQYKALGVNKRIAASFAVILNAATNGKDTPIMTSAAFDKFTKAIDTDNYATARADGQLVTKDGRASIANIVYYRNAWVGLTDVEAIKHDWAYKALPKLDKEAIAALINAYADASGISPADIKAAVKAWAKKLDKANNLLASAKDAITATLDKVA